MLKRIITCGVAVACLLAVPASAQSTITCGPLDDGRIADVFYKGTAIFWSPIVRYEYETAVLTISGPCEDIVKTFRPGEEIAFDLAEVERVLDGQYQWELRFMPAVDPGVRKELQASRGSGEEDDLWWSLWQKGAIPSGPSRDSAGFSVVNGQILDPGTPEEGQKSSVLAAKTSAAPLATAATAVATAATGTARSAASDGGGNPLATKDFVINDDLIVIGSTCVGFDCVNGESFGFDTIRLKENNLRIQFNDTSGSSFPTNNWQIRANSRTSGGVNFLGFVDQSTNGTAEDGTLVFAVEAGAGADALRVDNTGRVGLGTGNPILELHIADGDTPALRLDQNSSSGFTAQVWDVAGNESNFFVRDVTGGSSLPFRIRPGAVSNSLTIDADSEVGMGTISPNTSLHITKSRAGARVQSTGSATSDHASLFLQSSGGTTTTEFEIRANASTGSLEIKDVASAGSALKFQPGAANNSVVVGAAAGGFARVGIGTTSPQGDAGEHSLDVNGSIYQRGGLLHSDYVFDPDYELESIEAHAEFMWKNRHLPAVPGRQVDEQGREVIELGAHRRGMLEELEKAHIYIEQLNRKIEERDRALAGVIVELETLKAALTTDD